MQYAHLQNVMRERNTTGTTLDYLRSNRRKKSKQHKWKDKEGDTKIDQDTIRVGVFALSSPRDLSTRGTPLRVLGEPAQPDLTQQYPVTRSSPCRVGSG